MEFGESANFANINYHLPDAHWLCGTSSQKEPTFHLGCPIWTHKELISRLCPTNRNKQSSLEIYSQNFNSIELNSTYYNLPNSEQVVRWLDQVPADFKFFPKAPKNLTFHSRGRIDSPLFDRYLKCLDDFGDCLGESFLQFSPYVTPDNKRYLFELIEALPENKKFAMELRHPDWFSDDTLLRNLCHYLSKRNVNLLITDTPGRRDVLHMMFPTQRLMVRFKGNNAHESDFLRINDWLELIQGQSCFEQVSFFHHHSNESHCLDTIHYMATEIERRGLKANMKKPTEALPEQADLFT